MSDIRTAAQQIFRRADAEAFRRRRDRGALAQRFATFPCRPRPTKVSSCKAPRAHRLQAWRRLASVAVNCSRARATSSRVPLPASRKAEVRRKVSLWLSTLARAASKRDCALRSRDILRRHFRRDRDQNAAPRRFRAQRIRPAPRAPRRANGQTSPAPMRPSSLAEKKSVSSFGGRRRVAGPFCTVAASRWRSALAVSEPRTASRSSLAGARWTGRDVNRASAARASQLCPARGDQRSSIGSFSARHQASSGAAVETISGGASRYALRRKTSTAACRYSR